MPKPFENAKLLSTIGRNAFNFHKRFHKRNNNHWVYHIFYRLEFETRNKKKETKELAVLNYLEQKKNMESEKEDSQPEISTA